MLPLVLGLLACAGHEPAPDAMSDTSSDSAAPAAQVSMVLGGDWAEGTVSLVQIDPAGLGVGAVGEIGAVATAPAADTVDFPLYAPAGATLHEVDAAAHPGVRIAWLVPTLHPDTDGDGERSGEEDYWGVGEVWLLYVEGSPEGVPGLEGAVEGWNALQMNLRRLEPEAAGDLAAVPLSASLRVAEVELEGAWAGAPGNAGVVLVSRVAMQGGDVATPVLVQAMHASEFSLDLVDAPPDDHFTDLGSGVRGAVEIGLSFVDDNNSNGFNLSDSPVYHLCAPEDPVALLYFPEVQRLDFALGLTAVNGGIGWNAYDLGGSLLDRAVLGNLVAGPPCPAARAGEG